jgi:hypothetical protein
MRIKCKEQMYSLLKKGAFGNSLRVWNSAQELIDSGYDGLIGIRCTDIHNAPFATDLSIEEGLQKAKEYEKDYHSVLIYEASPKKHITLQGEYGNYRECYSLRYSFQKTHMRKALKTSPLYAYGKEAEFIVRRYLTEASYADLEVIFDTYKETPLVVEFTAYDIMVGNLMGRNCVQWEVRSY